jgi:hypothetical protein
MITDMNDVVISDDGRFAARCIVIEDEYGRESILLSACDIEDVALLDEEMDRSIISDYEQDIAERRMLNTPEGIA